MNISTNFLATLVNLKSRILSNTKKTLSLKSVKSYLNNSNKYYKVGEIELIPYKSPRCIDDASECISYSDGNEPYVAQINNATVFGDSDIILAGRSTIISDLGTHSKYGEYISFQYENIIENRIKNKVKLADITYDSSCICECIFLSGLATKHFGHWLADYLPKLLFIEQRPEFNSLPVLINDDMPSSHVEHLKNICNREIIYIKRNQSFIVKKLVVASSANFLPTEIISDDVNISELPGLSPRAMTYIQKKTLEKVGPYHGPRRKIFLSRKKCKWRILNNEDEVFNELEKLGFESICLEDLNAVDQVKLFQSADYIIGPNGSAFLNIIFSDKNVKILLLSAENIFNWGSFQGPMEKLGFKPYFLNTGCSDSDRWKHGNYSVNREDVIHAMNYINNIS